ncbi:hypothetical protein GQ43DRAFT_169426 [Delitschia confertaspora ATCC 74209]|uniref:Uncharacterized protein n=1 Tax=Delitschia confertaspora ATCC 74209 TaxID=1513339 RepID=A0A9P4JF50_9PLEO|nr:hypothetical protein GQ43DRAFT_169426 [Delitschia confertaspora ATCC 74209]
MGWFSSSSRSNHHTSSRPGYARSYAGSSYSSHSHRSSTSHYKRRPRDGYIQYLYHKLKDFLHQIWRYARRHPYKVFFMVIMPLVSGGVLHKLARKFGVNLPNIGGSSRGGAYGGGRDGGNGYYGSMGYEGEMRNGIGLQSLASGIGGLASVAKMAQAFM